MQGSVEINYSNKKLIASGIFHCFGNGNTTLKVIYRRDYINLDVNLIESNSEKSTLELHPKADDTLELRLTNYRKASRTKTIGPIAAGEIAGRPFYVLLGVSGGDADSLRAISYSVYVESDD